MKFNAILHPVDFSEDPQYALEVAHSLARDHHAKLVLLTTVDPPPTSVLPTSDMLIASASLSGEYLQLAARQLKAIADRITDIPVESVALIALPGDAIIELAQKYDIDLIVMGTHGRTGLSHLFMGSIAEYVLSRAPCPVLTIRPGTSPHLSKVSETTLIASKS